MGLWVALGGLALHVMLLLSVFDIYFRSPIVQGVQPHPPQHAPAARRLVLFSVDGMRAESFLEHTRTPFLRSIAHDRGLWGISNTRVPTESRPGHVAIIAGFYEDPSAVTKGWKKNPVDFDSVFNQSRYTWSWGADDILHIFSKGTNDGHIFTHSYNTEDQTFSTDRNTTLLDDWVFNNFRIFLKNANNNKGLMKKLHQDKIIFFLHLLGMDTSGHTHKPDSPEFVTNMKYVDDGISEMEKYIEEFYGHDQQTAYIMTSDHGMTNWGSHGAGEKHETETPYVIWGAGVAQSIPGSSEGVMFGLPLKRRKDITQADLAPLMSAAISIPIPVHSIGQLPVDLLNMTVDNRARAIYSNSRQLAAQYNTLREQVEENALRALYYPYRPLAADKYKEIIAFTEKLADEGQFEKLTILSEEIIQLSLSGLSYYHNYYQNILLTFVTLSFLGWIALLLTMLLEQRGTSNANGDKYRWSHNKSQRVRNTKSNAVFGLMSIVLSLVIFVQKLPIQYYLYSLVPVLLWWRVVSSAGLWMTTLLKIKQNHHMLKLFTTIACYTLGTIALVWSFEQRWWLSAPLLGMAVWPFLSTERRQTVGPVLLACWATSCVLLGVFSFLPVVGRNSNISLVILAITAWAPIMCYFQFKVLLPMRNMELETHKETVVIIVQSILLVMTLHNVYCQDKRFAESSPVNVKYQMVAWLILAASVILPTVSTNRLTVRLFMMSSSLLTVYTLLSVSHEVLFLITLILNQACWLQIEFQLAHSRKTDITEYAFASDSDGQKGLSLLSIERTLTEHDFRRAFFFLLYIIVSFFGTGNIASINSFEVRWVTCFITTFRPYIITALVLCKTIIPFLIVACAFRGISIITKAPTGYLIVIVLIFSDMMGVQFLYYVKNTGSWLEIGTSISQYVIAQVITVFIVVLHSVAKVMCETNISNFVTNVINSGKKHV